MRVVLLSFFNNFFCMRAAQRLAESGLTPRAICFQGDQVRESDSRIFGERFPGAQPVRIVDLVPFQIPTYFSKALNSDEALALLRSLEPQIFIQGGGPILTQNLLDIPTLGTINCHPGLLPKYRGSCCVEWAIYNDDPVGCTAHFVDAGLDTGPVISRSTLAINPGDTYHDVRRKIFDLQIESLVQAVKKVSDGFGIKDAEQQPDGSCWKTADQSVMQQVQQKLLDRKYRCYTTDPQAALL